MRHSSAVRIEAWVANSPMPAGKPQAIIRLYLNLAEHAIVLCADDNSRQATCCTARHLVLPLKKQRFGTSTVINDAPANGKALHLIANNAETQKQLTVRK